jgi:hypothetical protein
MGDLINVYDVVKTTPTSHTPPWRQLANCVRLYSTNSHIVAKNPLQCASMQILIFRALCTCYAPGTKVMFCARGLTAHFPAVAPGTPTSDNGVYVTHPAVNLPAASPRL